MQLLLLQSFVKINKAPYCQQIALPLCDASRHTRGGVPVFSRSEISDLLLTDPHFSPKVAETEKKTFGLAQK
jgi:hypothetical protein